jgi:hypothetical protein
LFVSQTPFVVPPVPVVPVEPKFPASAADARVRVARLVAAARRVFPTIVERIDAPLLGVVVASVAGALVEVGGPGVGVSAVAGEVAYGVTELFVAGPAERDGAEFAGLSGRGCGSGEADERFGGREAGSAVADLGEQSGGSDSAAAGQAGEDVAVGVVIELPADLGGEGLDLGDEHTKHGEEVPCV